MSVREKVLTMQNPAWIFQKNLEFYSQINFRKSHQISWNLDELLKSYKAEYATD